MKRPITPAGYAALREELQRLKSQRPEIARAIETARGHGDISENADYDAAKERSAMVEAKTRDLDAKLAHAQVIDPATLGEPTRVTFGTSVELEEVESGDGRTVTIVGADEPNVESGCISLESPLGRALIGKVEGDVVRVALPAGAKDYEVRRIFVNRELFPTTVASVSE